MVKALKTALITGANRGLGFEVARQLTEKAFHVFSAARDREAAEKAAAILQKNGAKISVVTLDVSDPDSIRRAAQEIATTVDHLDVLVNNAAILEDEHLSVVEIDAELMQRTLAVNTIGPLLVAQAFYSILAKSAFGRIINVSSGSGALSEMGT
jgi:NAD(P)-dependent dehydrogenase (short-subunit alcohol dehydrogenase family)